MFDESYNSLKVPPHSLESEQSVLGGLLIENTALDRVADVLNASDFYRHDHRLIYQHITNLINNNSPADIVTVAESLENTSELSGIGGLAYLGALAHNTPSSANIRRYAEIVRERAVVRQLIEVSSGITDSAFNPQGRDAKNQSTPRFPTGLNMFVSCLWISGRAAPHVKENAKALNMPRRSSRKLA